MEEEFSKVLLEDFIVTKAPTIVSVFRSPGPEPMEIDAIESSGDRRRATHHKRDVRSGRQMVCFRCKKLGHRPAECRSSEPISAHVMSTNNEGVFPVVHAKIGLDQ